MSMQNPIVRDILIKKLRISTKTQIGNFERQIHSSRHLHLDKQKKRWVSLRHNKITSFNQNLPPELIHPMLYVSRTVFHPAYDELDSSICRCWWRVESLLSWIYKVNIIAVTIRFLDPSLFGRLIAQPNLQRTRPKRKGNKDAEPSVYPLAKVENLFDFSIAKEKGST